MIGALKHILLLFALAAVCYVVATALVNSRLGFIVFLVAGMIAEVAFWVLFWRERRATQRLRASSR